MNILFLTMSNIYSIESYGIYADLMRKFRDEGNGVYIVSPRERRLGKPTRLEVVDRVKILGVKTLNLQKTNVVEKGVGQLLVENQYNAAIKQYLGGVKFDLILYSTPPITFTKVIALCKKQNPAAKTYLLLKDIFPQNAVDLGMMPDRLSSIGYRLWKLPKLILHKVFRKKEKKLYAISDYIGCMSPANVRYVIDHNPDVNPNNVEVAPNSLDLNRVKGCDLEIEERYDIFAKYAIPTDVPIFVYGGNLGKPQGIPFLICCLDANKSRKDCFFVVAGDGTEYSKIQAWVDEVKPQNMKLFKRLPKADYDKLVACSHVGLIFLDYRFLIPNYPSRLLAYLQSRKPIIACTDPNSDIGSIAEDNGYGYWSPSNDVLSFTAAIDKMLASDMKAMGEKGYAFMCANYAIENTYEAIMKHYL